MYKTVKLILSSIYIRGTNCQCIQLRFGAAAGAMGDIGRPTRASCGVRHVPGASVDTTRSVLLDTRVPSPALLITHLHMLRLLAAVCEHSKCFMNKFVIQFTR